MYFTTSAPNFLWGGHCFQFFTKNRPQKHQKRAILHTSQANGGLEPPRPPWIRYCLELVIFYLSILKVLCVWLEWLKSLTFEGLPLWCPKFCQILSFCHIHLFWKLWCRFMLRIRGDNLQFYPNFALFSTLGGWSSPRFFSHESNMTSVQHASGQI